jgi:hypothetical protein
MTENRWRIAVAVLTVLLIAAVAGCVVLWGDRSDLKDLEGHRTDEAAATKAAEGFVYSYLTYDYRTYEKDLSWMTERGTDAFREGYTDDELAARKKLIVPGQLISRGRVVDSAATWDKDGEVTVLVFTDQTLTDRDIRRSGKPALHTRSGLELTMVREHGKWLVDKMVQLQFA